MKFLSVFLLIHIWTYSAFAQFKIIGQSESFDEPTQGYGKLLQLTNGNTIFLLAAKSGIAVKLYDKTYHLRAENQINRPENDMKDVESVFEMRGDLVFFYRTVENNQDVLYRLTIDGKKGNFKHSDKIASMDVLSHHLVVDPKVHNSAFQHAFYIRKDPSDQYYAVATVNSYAGEKGKQIEIVYYGADNNEIARAYYAAPEKYKFIQYVDMVVIGSQKVTVLAYAGNTTRRKNRDGELVLATLDSGSHTVNLDELDLSREIIVEGGITRFNPVTENVVLLAACRQPKDNGFTPVMAFVNPFERRVENVFTIFPERANSKSEELFGKKNGFTGMPQNMFIDNEGDISVVFEEMITYSDNYGSTEFLGDLAVSRFDPNGKETGSYLIPKAFGVDGYLPTFYHSIQEGTAARLYGGNQFKHFSYLNGPNGMDFILFNDLEENAENIKKGKKPRRITGVGACDAFYFPINGDNPLPDRQFVFGKPDGRRDHQLALFSISDYDRGNNKYATLQLDHEGRSKQVRIVWMQPS